MKKFFLLALFSILMCSGNVNANTVVKEITFDDWTQGISYKSGDVLPDPDMILYSSVIQDDDILTVTTQSKQKCVGVIRNNTYLILFLQEGLLSFDLYGSSTGIEVRSMVANTDGSWSKGNSIEFNRDGASLSDEWVHFYAEIPEDGWYAIKCKQDIFLDNIKNETVGFNISGYVRDADGQVVAGAAIAMDGRNVGVSDENGYYMVGAGSGDSCSVTVSCPGYESVTEEISLTGDVEKDFVLTQQMLSLRAVIADESGTRLSGASVSLNGFELNDAGNGVYTIENLPAAEFGTAEWPLVVSLEGYRIFGNDNLSFNFESRVLSLLAVREQSYSISGKVANEWNSEVGDVEVELLYNGEKIEESVFTDEHGDFTIKYTPVHFSPAEISDVDFMPIRAKSSSAVFVEVNGEGLEPARAEETDDNTGYQLRLSKGTQYQVGTVDVPTAEAGANEYALDDTIKLDSDTITVVEQPEVETVTINGTRYNLQPNTPIMSIDGIIVTRIGTEKQLTLPSGFYIVGTHKVLIK